jgi:nucleotide-binding universal stress UspA family protein
MKKLHRIIVGHDLSEGGDLALKSAAVLAHRFAAALRVVHVLEPLEPYQRVSHPLTSPYTLEEIAQKSGAKLKDLAGAPELAPLQAQYEVRTGKPFVELITAQRAWQADLIVVGGTSQVEEPFFGSTALRLLRKAPVPVMVAKSRLSATAKTFLVPTDFSACAKTAAEEALVLAQRFEGRVIFLHVPESHPYAVAYAHEFGVSVPAAPLLPEQFEPDWATFLSGLSLNQVAWEKYIEEGQAAPAIIHQAKLLKADMIVMGTHGRSGLPHILLGSVAEKVMRSAACPVLTIRQPGFGFQMP